MEDDVKQVMTPADVIETLAHQGVPDDRWVHVPHGVREVYRRDAAITVERLLAAGYAITPTPPKAPGDE